jgi:hypothetical protein
MINHLFHVTPIVISLFLTTRPTGAGQPCAPFEGGDVDPEIQASMRAAVAQGRLLSGRRRLIDDEFFVRHFPFQEFRGELPDLVGGLALSQIVRSTATRCCSSIPAFQIPVTLP